jgi:hypothetical protein
VVLVVVLASLARLARPLEINQPLRRGFSAAESQPQNPCCRGILLGWRVDRCCRVTADDALSRDAQILTGCSYLDDGRPHQPRLGLLRIFATAVFTLFC